MAGGVGATVHFGIKIYILFPFLIFPLRDILCRIICLLKASILECWEFLRGREWNMKSAGVVLWEIYISNFSFQSKAFWQNMKIDLITMLNASTLHSIWSTYTAAYRVYQRLLDTRNAISTEEKILHKTKNTNCHCRSDGNVICSVPMLRCINEVREPVTYEPHLIEKFGSSFVFGIHPLKKVFRVFNQTKWPCKTS